VIVPDANLLLYAYNQDSPFHERAARWWRACLSGSEAVGLAPAVALGFVRLGTQARVFQAPLTVGEAAEVVRSWLARPMVRVLEGDRGSVERALGLLEACGTAGNLVTDAQLAALALEHRAVIHSADADFSRFAGVRWRNPGRD